MRRFVVGKDTEFVRVHGPDNQQRAWLVRASEIQGMSAREIQQYLALPRVPTYISDVLVPAGTRIQFGRIAAQPDFGVIHTRGIQYQLLDELPPSAYRNMRPLP